jgi:hypothetical protein
MAETGRTRVRRFVTEREVAQDVTLHEEHAEVLRKAVSDPTYAGEIDWADGTIEIIETAEHALVNKTARIVEEVGWVRSRRNDHGQTAPPADRNRATWPGRQGHSRASYRLGVSPWRTRNGFSDSIGRVGGASGPSNFESRALAFSPAEANGERDRRRRFYARQAPLIAIGRALRRNSCHRFFAPRKRP